PGAQGSNRRSCCAAVSGSMRLSRPTRCASGGKRRWEWGMSEEKPKFAVGGIIRSSEFRAMPGEEIVALPVAEKFAAYEQRIAELEDHYRSAREIIQGERLRREEAERVSLKAQA